MSSRPNGVGWFLVVLFLGGGIAFWITLPGIFIGQIWVAVSLLLALVYVSMNRRARAAQARMRSGIPARATVLGVEQTGVQINNQPQVKLRLRIEGEGLEAPFDVERKFVVPLVALGALSNGRPLSVYVDPDDHDQITVDWGAALTPMTISQEGGAPVALGDDPETVQTVLKVLDEYGVAAQGTVDLRAHPQAREAVLSALRERGVDAAHAAAAAAPGVPIRAPAGGDTPMLRITKLQELREAGLISDEEFEEHRQRILRDV